MHRPLRALLPLLLALPTPMLGLSLLPSAAYAQSGVLGAPIVDLVPMGEIIGDGRSAATLYVVALGKDGQPLADITGRLTAAEGTVSRLEAVGPGLFRASWTPPAVDQARAIELTIKGKVEGHGAVSTRVPVTVVPGTAHTMSIRSNPGTLVLGQDPSATLTIQLSGGSSGTLDSADLAVRASSGTVANVTPLGKGQYSLLFTAPAKLFPHLALITIADRRDPSGTVGAFALPLSGKAAFPVTGLPGSTITVRVAGVEFGPVTADTTGKASISLVVPPGTDQATVLSVLGEQRQESPLDLKVPAVQRVQIVPTAPAVVADGSSATQVRVFVATPNGQPDSAAQVTFSASTGSVGAARHEGGGVYLADWVPAAQDKALTARLSVKITDPRGDQEDHLDVRLLPARPSELSLSSEPSTLGTAQRLQATARSSGGAVRGVSFGVAGATAEGQTMDRGDGSFTQSFTIDAASTQVAIAAAATVDASSNPLDQVLVLPSSERLLNDGRSAVVLTVLTLDAQGQPVGNAPVALSIARGDARITPSVTTDAHGLAHAVLTAGTTPGMLVVGAATGGHASTSGVLQLPNAAAGLDLPVGGGAADAAIRTRWETLVRGLSLGRESTAPVVAALPMTGPGVALTGNVAALTLAPAAASVAPGQPIDLSIEAKDDQGRATAGRQLQVFANAGTVGAVTDQGGGRYTVRIVAPASGTDVIRVTVVSPQSGVSSMVQIPVSAAPTWGVVATAGTPQQSTVQTAPTMPVTPPTTPVATTPPPSTSTTATVSPTPPPPGATGDFPWLRLQAGFVGGFYSYAQTPFSDAGVLYGDRIAFGGDDTAAAGTAGLGLSARAWSPGMKYFGAELSTRANRYAVELADFDDAVVPDWVSQTEALLLARLPVDLDKTRLHLGARAGIGIGDFMVYRQDNSDSTPVLDYGPLVVPSFNAGAELGLDHDGTVFADFAFTMGFNGGGGLYSTDLGGRLGWAFLDNLYAYVDGGMTSRSTTVFVKTDGDGNQEAGDLDDRLVRVGGGLGTQF